MTREQLDFVGLLLRYRTNLQRLADELGIAYNTVRSRLDEVVEAIGSPTDAQPPPPPDPRRRDIIERLASRELSVDEAIAALRDLRAD